MPKHDLPLHVENHHTLLTIQIHTTMSITGKFMLVKHGKILRYKAIDIIHFLPRKPPFSTINIVQSSARWNEGGENNGRIWRF